jgi:hypothetical protein
MDKFLNDKYGLNSPNCSDIQHTKITFSYGGAGRGGGARKVQIRQIPGSISFSQNHYPVSYYVRVRVTTGLNIAFPASFIGHFEGEQACCCCLLLNLLLLTVERAACDSLATVWPRLPCSVTSNLFRVHRSQ